MLNLKLIKLYVCCCTSIAESYYINITFPARVIVESISPRDDTFDYHPSRKCNIYFIIPNRTLDPLFSEVPGTSLTQ